MVGRLTAGLTKPQFFDGREESRSRARINPIDYPEPDVSTAKGRQRPVSLVADDLYAEPARPELTTAGEFEGIKKPYPEYSPTRMFNT